MILNVGLTTVSLDPDPEQASQIPPRKKHVKHPNIPRLQQELAFVKAQEHHLSVQALCIGTLRQVGLPSRWRCMLQ